MFAEFYEESVRVGGYGMIAPGYYARCYGEGLYQAIFVPNEQFLDNDSVVPIRVTVRSLFEMLDDCDLIPGPEGVGNHFLDFELQGNQTICSYYDRYEDGGGNGNAFLLLDSIDTHQSLLAYDSKVNTPRKRTADLGGKQNFASAEVYLVVGNTYKAQARVAQIIATCLSNAVSSNGGYKGQGNEFAYLDILETEIRCLKQDYFLWDALLGRRNDKLHQHLQDNYERNMLMIKKYGVPIHQSFRTANIPDYFF